MRYRPASKDVISETFSGEVVVVDLSTGRYFSPSPSGGVLWRLLSAGADVNAICAASGKGTEFVSGFASQLHALGLLTPVENQALGEPDQVLTSELAALADAPEMTVFDDLADLFLADPIHDVEEGAGWPVTKER
jgi:hypothetical protein